MDGPLSRYSAHDAALDDASYEAAMHRYTQAWSALERGDFAAAVRALVAAGDALPPPLEDWDASTQILSTLAEAYWQAWAYGQARTALQHAMHCPNAIGDPRLHLRLGQVQFELGDMSRASDELVRAYMGGGRSIFAQEDPKYLEQVQAVLDPPVSGEW